MIEEVESAKVQFHVTPYYFTVTNGNKTWYWVKETGEFDGTSWDMHSKSQCKNLVEVTG